MPVSATTNAMETTTTGLTTLSRTEWDVTEFLKVLREKLKLVPLGRRNDLPRHSGNTARWHLFNNVTAATSTLSEGVDPTSIALTESAVTVSYDIYGKFFELSEELEIQTINGTRQQFVDAAAHQAALTLDVITYNALASASNTNDEGATLTAEGIRRAVKELVANNAENHPMTPGGDFFCGVFGSNALYDLIGEGAPTYYQAKVQAFEDNLTSPLRDTPRSAAIHNCMLKMTTNAATDSTNDIGYIFGDDAYGVTSLDSDILQPKVVIVPPTPSLASPLGMRGTIGWKARYASVILDNNRLVEVLTDT